MTSKRSEPDVAIRVANREDIWALVSLRSAWTRERSAFLPVDPSDFEAEFAAWFERESTKRTFWLATRQERPIGMVNLLRFERMPSPTGPTRTSSDDARGAQTDGSGGGWGYLGNMFVVASERNAGVGERLLHHLLEHADGIGLERIVLNPTELSVSFYQRHGFEIADQLMLRPLPSKRM